MSVIIAAELQREFMDKRLAFVKRRWDVAADFLREGIISVNTEGFILQINQAALNFLEIIEEEVLNRTLVQIIPCDSIRSLSEGDHKLFLKDHYISFQKNDRSFNLLLSVNPVIRGGDFLGSIVVLKDFKSMEKVPEKAYRRPHEVTFDAILGRSREIRQAVRLAEIAAQSDATILLLGESGTGKELFARAIHANSQRGISPFVAINCSAIPEALLESELFGYEDGAFTGAKRGGRSGKIAIADKGTLFLDEIGDMPQYMQTKLLRVLQEQELYRLGGVSPVSVDIRVIAATHRNLQKMLKQGTFREDLFYRLNVIPIRIPPLREHIDDLDLLVSAFLDKYCRRHHKRIDLIEPELLESLRTYSWPGNVRELENVIQYGVCLEEGPVLRKQNILPRIGLGFGVGVRVEKDGGVEPLASMVRRFENRKIFETIERFKSEPKVIAIEKAARSLQISRATIYKKLGRRFLNIEKKSQY
jgi:transcriptional regulator with PAS, ATPase and Fis domain